MKPLIIPKRFTVEQAKKTPAWEPNELGSKLVCMLKAKRILKRIERSTRGQRGARTGRV